MQQILYYVSGDQSHNMVRKYDVHSHTSKCVAIIPTAGRRGFACAFANEQLFIIGGWTIIQKENVLLVQSVNINTGESKYLKPLRHPRSRFSAVYFNNEMHIFGGCNASRILRLAEK